MIQPIFKSMNTDPYLPQPLKFLRPYCDKTPYTKRDAQTAINARRHGRNAPRSLRIYHCDKCNAWHLTGKLRYDDAFDQ